MGPQLVTGVPPTTFIRVAAVANQWPLPDGGYPPPPPGLVPAGLRYDSSSIPDLENWLSVLVLDRDCELVLSDNDLDHAHVALRHVSELEVSPFSVKVLLPMTIRKNKAFTPWLVNAVTVNRNLNADIHGITTTLCALSIMSVQKHIHSNSSGNKSKHAASFDFRVGGSYNRILVDSGANASCISASLVKTLNLPVFPVTMEDKNLIGVGGAVVPVGYTTAPIKIGKFQSPQRFIILEGDIAGYQCLLGEDFMINHSASLVYSPTQISLVIGNDLPKPIASISRKLEMSILAHTTKGTGVNPPQLESNQFDLEANNRELARHYKDILDGLTPAYEVTVGVVDKPTGKVEVLPALIRSVLDKHSQPGGTLCGSIPPNTHAKGYQCKIQVKPDVEPVCIRQYRMTPLEKAELVTQIDDFITKGWIELSTSGWSSPVLFIPKPNGKLRFCLDYRRLNTRTEKDSGPIPHQSELLDQLRGAKYFSALDLASGYYQLEMENASRKYTAFPTPYGLYQWKVMPMGLTNAPAVFQTAMNQILKSHILAGYCLVYLDDIIIKSPSLEEHAIHVDAILNSLHKHNLFCQLPKCHWAKQSLKYLGHIVSGEGVLPDPAKVATLTQWVPPLDLIEKLADSNTSPKEATVYKNQIATECRRFLGFMNYFNRFIPRFSDIAVVLHEQTKKEAPPWSAPCTECWNMLKLLLSNATLMHHPDFALPFHVFSDASIRAVGGVLMQLHENSLRPIAYIARKMLPAEVNYSTTEQELLAIIFCFGQWRCYLEGSQVVLHTDHEPLTWVKTQVMAKPNRRISRWLEILSRFHYEIVYIKGDDNLIADALTRMLSLPDSNDVEFPGDWPRTLALNKLVYHRYPGASKDECSDRSNASKLPEESGGAKVRLGRRARHTKCANGSVQDCLSPSQAGAERGTGEHWVAAAGHTRARASSRITGNNIKEVNFGVGKQRGARGESRGKTDSDAPARKPGNSGRGKRGRGGEAPYSDKLKPVLDVSDISAPHKSVCTNIPENTLSPNEVGLKNNRMSDSMKVVHDDTLPENIPQLLDPESVDDSERPDPSLAKFEVLISNLFDRIRDSLVGDEKTQTVEQRLKMGLVEIRGLYYKGNLLYIPHNLSLIADILHWFHDVPWCGHLGIAKTKELVQRQFWWPTLASDVQEYVLSCVHCQANKPDRRRRNPPLVPLSAPTRCWDVVGVDLITSLPKTALGQDAIVVFSCHCSKGCRLVADEVTLNASGFAQIYFEQVFVHYGMPSRIVSDRGTTWNNEFFRELCGYAGIQLSLSTPYHPQTNGLVERTNEVIGTAIRHFVAADHTTWARQLPFIEFALNNAYHAAIGTTPFRLNRITVPNDPFTAITSNLAKAEGIVTSANEPSGLRTAIQAHEEFNWARRCVQLAKDKMQESYNSRGATPHLYQTGQKVWMSMKHVSLRHPSQRHKLVPKFYGPVSVLEMVGPNCVRLDLPESIKIHDVVNVVLIKPFIERAGQEAPPVNISGQLEWEVVSIINHSITKVKKQPLPVVVEFLVTWKGGYDNSWHEFVDLEGCLETLEQYLRSFCTKATRCQIYKGLTPTELLELKPDLQEEAKKAAKSVSFDADQ